MNDDDADFKPNQITSSNLTSLFDTNKPHPSGNQSLTYTAPKAPRTGENSPALKQSSSKSVSSEKLNIITSKSVQVYKLENGKYVNQGTAGVAIIGNCDLHIYQIILYRNNKDYLSKTQISPNFIFTVLENNYASFYDNARQNWSILFSTSSNVQDFSKQVAVAKYNSQSKQEKILVQDLLPIAGVKTKRDIMKVIYSCSVLSNDEVIPFKDKKISSVIDLTDANFFPWYEGLKGCSDHCKRIIIIPYKLSAPWTNEIEPNTSVLMELEIESIASSDPVGVSAQAQKEKTKSNERGKITKVQEESTTDSSGDEDHCKAKSASLKDSIFHSRSNKANLISRIAKMGQALPLQGAFLSGPSDSEEESSSVSKRMNKLRAVNNAVQQPHQNVPVLLRPCSPQAENPNPASPQNQHSICEMDVSWQQEKMKGDINVASQQSHPYTTAPLPAPSKENDSEKIQLPQAKAVDSELRITINKVSEKVDHVLNKLQSLDSNHWDKLRDHQSPPVLDPMNVLSSIQGVIAENENLKTEIQKQKHKINEQDSKIQSLVDLTQRCVEKCSMPEGNQTAIADKIVNLEEKLRSLNQFMTEANATINQLASEIEKYKDEISRNQRHITESNVQVRGLLDELKGKEEILRNLEANLDRTLAENEVLTCLKEEQRNEILHYKRGVGETSACSKEAPHISAEDSFEEIRKVMNAVNKKLQSHFESDKNYLGSDVKEIVATTIKDVTMEYLRYKSKLRSTSKSDGGHRESGRTSSETSRGERTSREPTSTSQNVQNLDSEVSGRQRPPDFTKVASHALESVEDHDLQLAKVRERPVETGQLEEHKKSMLEVKKSHSRPVETVPHASSQKSPCPSLERSELPEITKNSDSVRNDSAEGKKSCTQPIQEPKSNPETRRPTFAEDLSPEVGKNVAEARSSVRGSSGALTRATSDSAEGSGSATRAPSHRSGGSIPMSGNYKVECEDVNVEIESSDIARSNRESLVIGGGRPQTPSHRSNLTPGEQASTASKSTVGNIPRVRTDENATEDEGSDISEIEKSTSTFGKTASDFTGENIQPSPRKSILTSKDQVTSPDKSIEGNVLHPGSRMRISNEIEKINPEIEESVAILNRKASYETGKTPSELRSHRSILTSGGRASKLGSFLENFGGQNSAITENENGVVGFSEAEKITSYLDKTWSDVTGISSNRPPSFGSGSAAKDEIPGMVRSVTDDPGSRSGTETWMDEEFENFESARSSLSVNKTSWDINKATAACTPPHRSTLENQISGIDKSIKGDDLGARSRIGVIREEVVENVEIERSRTTLRRSCEIPGAGTRSESGKSRVPRANESIEEAIFANGSAITPLVREETDDTENEKSTRQLRVTTSNVSGASEASSHGSTLTVKNEISGLEGNIKDDISGLVPNIKDVISTNTGGRKAIDENIETDSDIPDKTSSKVTKDKTSQPISRKSLPAANEMTGSLKRESKIIAREDDRDDEACKGDASGDVKSTREENENENEEAEKNGFDEREISSASQENLKSSGSNAIYESCVSADYYQNWGLSKPPPLPSNDEDETDDEVEEWLW